MRRERKEWDGDRREAGEVEEARRGDRLDGLGRVVEGSDIQQECLEQPTGEGGAHAEAMRAAEPIARVARALDEECEEVARIVSRRRDQGIGQFGSLLPPGEVDVLSRASAVRQPQVEGEAALDRPPAWRDGGEPREQTVVGDPLPVAGDGAASPSAMLLMRCSRARRKSAAVAYFTASPARSPGR